MDTQTKVNKINWIVCIKKTSYCYEVLVVAYSDKTIESIVEEIEKFSTLFESTKKLKSNLEVIGTNSSLFRQNNRIDSWRNRKIFNFIWVHKKTQE
jgi:hypothetical protein